MVAARLARQMPLEVIKAGALKTVYSHRYRGLTPAQSGLIGPIHVVGDNR